MSRNEIKKKFGISNETFNFYLSMKFFDVVGEDDYYVDPETEDFIIEKSTVYKFCFSDSFIDDIKNFKRSIKHNSKVKVFTKEEIEAYKKKNGE